jgi:superfamily I DNA/RNA helicase
VNALKSNFAKDLKVEMEVSYFIDKYLYPYLGDNFERQDSIDQQKKGIDIIVNRERTSMLIDDKCAFYYANKNLGSFTFELSYLKEGSKREGWLLNNNMSTTHYNVMWLNTKDKNINTKNITFHDIQNVEAMLISKQNLLDYLDSLGYDLKTLSSMDAEFRYSNTTRKRLTPHIELLISNHIVEKPVNLKINKTELSKLADLHVNVTENQLLDLKTQSIIKVTKDNNIINPAGLRAEIKVLSAIKKYAVGRDCFPFLHFPLHKKGFQGRNEIDILTVDRETGITVIEVKGITINQIETIQGGDWYYSEDFYENKKNPFKQAETQLNVLCQDIEKDAILFRSFTKRVVIALPYITRAEWKERGFDNKINIPPILFKEDLTSVDELKKIENYYIYQPSKPLDDNQWELIKKFFSIKSNSTLDLEDLYSVLYVFPTAAMFEDKKTEIACHLSNGTKVTALCYFEIDKKWREGWVEFEDNYQLQCFSNLKQPPIEEEIVLEDGEDSLPYLIVDDFESFNYKQYQIVHAPYDSNLMTTAGAGTGKTHVIIDRIMFLLSKGVSLKDVIMITFTNDSTNEMKKRLQNKLTILSKLTGKVSYGKFAEEVKDMQISTIHSFSKSVLTNLAHELGYGRNVRIRSFIHQKKQIIHNLIDEFYRAESTVSIHSLEHYKLVNVIQKFWDEIEKKGLSKQEIQDLDWGKALDSSLDSIHQLFQYVFEHAERCLDKLKKEENALSINDLIRKIKDLSHDETKMKQLQLDKYLFMDEFQDSDNVQIDLVASLANYLDYKLFVVGDVKQSIYRFRGADYKSFDLLNKKVKATKGEESTFQSYSLNQNYRSASTILDKLDNLFAKWGEKDWLSYEEKLIGMNKRNELANEFQFIEAEAKQIKDATINAIRYSMRLTEPLAKDKNRKIALIVRTNAQAKQVNDWCKSSKISTLQNLDGTFYTCEAVRDFKSLVDGLLFPRDAKHVLNTLHSPYFRYQIPYKILLPFNGENDAILSFIYSKIGMDFTRYVEQLKTYPVMAVIQKIISEKGLFVHLEEYYMLKYGEEVGIDNFVLKYKKNLFHLFNIIQQQFDMMNTTLYNIHQWLTLQMRTNRTENEPMVESPNHSVEITTVHRSKGLQYHTVIIPKTTNPFDFERTTFYIEEEKDEKQLKERKVAWFIKELNSRSSHFKELDKYNKEEVYKEETRLLYVAMTRVMERLVVFIPKSTSSQTWAEIIDKTGVEVTPYDR